MVPQEDAHSGLAGGEAAGEDPRKQATRCGGCASGGQRHGEGGDLQRAAESRGGTREEAADRLASVLESSPEHTHSMLGGLQHITNVFHYTAYVSIDFDDPSIRMAGFTHAQLHGREAACHGRRKRRMLSVISRYTSNSRAWTK